MTKPALRTVMIGFGKIAQGYAADPVMAATYPYATHAQVLVDHKDFQWAAVVEPSAALLDVASNDWKIFTCVGDVSELPENLKPEVAVIATPPGKRLEVIKSLPGLKGIIMEKPLATHSDEARTIVDYCAANGILLQVNFFRRADELFRSLASGQLLKMIGDPQCASSVYGNGLMNNGSHMIDLARMMLGEVVEVSGRFTDIPCIAGDRNVSFTLIFRKGIVTFHPLDFEYYRENSLEIWGTSGRLAIYQEGLNTLWWRIGDNRALQGAKEISSENPQSLAPTLGKSLYHLYSNLAAAIHHGVDLWSPGQNALTVCAITDKIIESAENNGQAIKLG